MDVTWNRACGAPYFARNTKLILIFFMETKYFIARAVDDYHNFYFLNVYDPLLPLSIPCIPLLFPLLPGEVGEIADLAFGSA